MTHSCEWCGAPHVRVRSYDLWNRPIFVCEPCYNEGAGCSDTAPGWDDFPLPDDAPPRPVGPNRTPHDRGGADFYYRRPYAPNLERAGIRIAEDAMTPEELDEYAAGWADAEAQGDQKDPR